MKRKVKLGCTTLMAVVLLASSWVQAESNWFFNADDKQVAIGGYDVVAYFTQTEAIKGQSAHQATFQGLTYLFASTKNRKAFEKDPKAYLPQYGGWCAFACGVEQAKYGFAPVRFAADPKSFLVVEDKLYLFAKLPNFDAKAMWEKESHGAMTQRADGFWQGRLKLGKSVGKLPQGMSAMAPMETAQFAPFIGNWKNTVKWMRNLEDKTYGPEIEGTWSIRFGWDGFGIDDDWRQVGVPGSGGPAHRFFDPAAKKWVMVYMPANQPRSNIWVMEGTFNQQGELHGEFSGKDPRGRDFMGRIRFFNIQTDRFSWRHDRSYDEGKTWIEKVAVSESERVK